MICTFEFYIMRFSIIIDNKQIESWFTNESNQSIKQ